MTSNVKTRIRLVDGRWYAFVTGSPKRSRHQAMNLGIRFCNRLSNKPKRATKEPK